MSRIKYFLTIVMGTFIYVALSMTIGQNSIRCIKQMEEQKRIISKQTSDIQNIHSELELELTALKNDKAVIASYARKLDYVSENEKLIKITGLKPAQTTLYDTGSVIRHNKIDFLPEKYCKIIGLCFALGMSIIFFLCDVNNGNIVFGKKRKSIVTGIPVYDLPQM